MDITFCSVLLIINFLFSKDAPDELPLLSVTIQGQQSLDFHCASCIDLEKLLEVPFIR